MPEQITDEKVRSLVYSPDLSGVVEYELKNGMNVVIVPHGQAPVVRATLIMGGGSAQDLNGNMDLPVLLPARFYIRLPDGNRCFQ